MSEAQSGTPDNTPVDTNNGGTVGATQDGSGNDAQKWQEALKWKQKAEEFNRLERELQERNAQIEQLSRLAYGGGQAATDPTAELMAKLQEQATFDPVAQATLLNMQETAMVKAEAWLTGQLAYIPASKRDKVASIVRNAGYQIGVSDALNMVTDPDTKTLAQQLAELKAENERLRVAKTNGVSPSSVAPASASADDSKRETIPFSEYAAVLKQGGQRAQELMQAVGSGRTKLVRE